VIDVAASTPGSYSVAYNIPASGCQLAGSNNASITISSTVTPVTGFSYTTPVCSNAASQSPILTTGFTTGGTFSSTAGLSINSTTGVINVAASTPGSYSVAYNIAANGCQLAGSNNASITISSTVTPVTGFSYTTPVCSNAANQSPTLVSGFTTGGTFSSTAGLSINSTTGVINVAASTPGSYSVAYNIPANGCQIAGSNSANININLTPGAPVVTNGSLCGAGQVNLSASGQGILNWYSDAGLANQVNTGSLYQPILSNSSTFYVQANNNGCLSPVSAVTATIHEIPAKPELGPSQSLCPGDRITLNAGNYASYNWSTLATTPTLTVTNPGLYYVVVGNGTGCTQSDSVNILAGQNCEDIYFPTAFSPNGDGQNDQFGPLGNVAAVSDYTLIIYNRFGELVFRSNSVYGKWDGRYKSLLTPNTNYVWFCNYRFQGGAIRQKKGNLLLIK
jgi:gliding motility-associated-like protein